jgi:hypothetical protein
MKASTLPTGQLFELPSTNSIAWSSPRKSVQYFATSIPSRRMR